MQGNSDITVISKRLLTEFHVLKHSLTSLEAKCMQIENQKSTHYDPKLI